MKKGISIAMIMLAFVFSTQAQGWGDKLKNASKKVQTAATGSSSSLTTGEIVEGLKEALVVGSKNSSSNASKKDGYFKNTMLFIPFPPEAIKVKNSAEKVGMKSKVDEFVMTLNRAAEEAAIGAKDVFVNAVKNMSVGDAMKILKGADDAATQYLRKTTYKQLYDKFLPVVKNATKKVDVTKYWTPLINNYNRASKFTGGEKINPDLDAYVTEKAIDGLFKLIAQEEAKIRKDPLARVSDILKKVFA